MRDLASSWLGQGLSWFGLVQHWVWPKLWLDMITQENGWFYHKSTNVVGLWVPHL